jgi:ribosomal protein L29
MDIEDYKQVDGAALKAKIRSLSRSELDEQIRRFGGQYALLCQRLEAVYNREARFAKIRPGGLDEIDEAIRLAEPDSQKEMALLKSFRELNRILVPFMDVYEEQVLSDLKQMSKEELQAMGASLSEQLASAAAPKDPADYRAAQNASGTLRLAALMKEAIARELKERFGYETE